MTEPRAAVLKSIQIGTPKSYGFENAENAHDQLWTTGFYKTPVAGRVFAATTNLAGDGQADLEHHGGVDKAVLAYSADHYPKWHDELHMPEMQHGAFGENLTIAGLSEASVCIGDVYGVGTAIFEVSQPRQPCWKLARRWRMHELTPMVVRNGRSGWYFRVLQDGWIEADMPVTLMRRPNPAWPVVRAHDVLHHRKAELALTLELAEVPRLSAVWVKELRERAERLGASSVAPEVQSNG